VRLISFNLMFKLGEQFCIAFSSLEVGCLKKNYDSVPLNALKSLIIHGLNQRCLVVSAFV
jgi:hypothetical protein